MYRLFIPPPPFPRADQLTCTVLPENWSPLTLLLSTNTLTGLLSETVASWLTWSVMVAEKRRVCRVLAHDFTISFICSRKHSSSIRSDQVIIEIKKLKPDTELILPDIQIRLNIIKYRNTVLIIFINSVTSHKLRFHTIKKLFIFHMILKLKKEIILRIRFKYHMLGSQQNIRLIFSPDPDPTYAFNQCCRSGSGSILDP